MHAGPQGIKAFPATAEADRSFAFAKSMTNPLKDSAGGNHPAKLIHTGRSGLHRAASLKAANLKAAQFNIG